MCFGPEGPDEPEEGTMVEYSVRFVDKRNGNEVIKVIAVETTGAQWSDFMAGGSGPMSTNEQRAAAMYGADDPRATIDPTDISKYHMTIYVEDVHRLVPDL